MRDNMLKIENLKATVDDKVILNDFNMIINDGETHVIMGPNGVENLLYLGLLWVIVIIKFYLEILFLMVTI